MSVLLTNEAQKKPISTGSIQLNTKKGNFLTYLKNNYQLYLFLLPAIAYIIIFHYIPLYGVQIAFKNFLTTKGVWGSEWVGLKHFIRFFNSFYFENIIKNTVALSVYSIIAGFPIPIFLALILNQLPSKRYKKVVQTVTYAPYFISMVVVCGMIVIFLSPRSGMMNRVIELFGHEAINFLGAPEYFRSTYVISGIWQTSGWSTIIYLAALSGINPELHEAAIVDGATKRQRIWHIDIPGIIPTAVILLILSVGSIMSVGFEKAYLLQNDLNSATSEIISTYVYKVGLIDNQFSFSSAVGLFNSIINLIILVSVNAIARKVSQNSLW